MDIALSILFLVTTTLCGAYIAHPLIVRLSSAPLIAATAWFVGQYAAAFGVYYVSVALVKLGLSQVLFKAAAGLTCAAGVFTALALRSRSSKSLRAAIKHFRSHIRVADILASVAAFTFAYLFFLSQLRTDEGVIKTALIYWDFPIHAPIIQGFSEGDNFPAQNNSLAGVPLTYHFFFDFLTSIYAALGLDLVGSVNTVSTVALGMLLACIFGLTTEIFGSRLCAGIATILAITTGSLRIVYDIQKISNQSFWEWILSISSHPYEVALLPTNVAGYNGNMFNMFYFLAERQMIFASIFLLVAMTVLYYRSFFSIGTLVGIGVAAGWFMQWHLFVTIAVVMMIATTGFLGKHRTASGALLLGMCCLVGYLAFEMRDFTRSDLFFADIKDYPRFNPEFATKDPLDPVSGYPLTPLNFVWYYLFAYGIKFFIIPLGFIQLWKRNRDFAIITISLALPTFIAINTVQLSPLSVYDNHKWLRPLNLVLDVVVAFSLTTTFFSRGTFLKGALGVFLVALSTLGGAVELFPYLLPIRETPREKIYSPRMSPLTTLIKSSTPRRAVFMTGNTLETHLAGRLTFFSNPSDEGGATGMTVSFRINESSRGIVRARIYNAKTIESLCQTAHEHNVDYVEMSESSPTMLSYPPSAHWPLISAANRYGELISFLDVAALCAPGASFEQAPGATSLPYVPLTEKARNKAVSLTSLFPSSIVSSYSDPVINQSFDGSPLVLAGKQYESGLGLHPPIVLTYSIPKGMNFFRGIIGLDDDVSDCSFHSAVARFIDHEGKVFFDSGLIVSPSTPLPFMVNVRNKKQITIQITDSGDGMACDHVDLVDAYFTESSAG